MEQNDQQTQKQPLSRSERVWVLYDVGNSAFTLLISTILPIYFNGLAGAAGLTSPLSRWWWPCWAPRWGLWPTCPA